MKIFLKEIYSVSLVLYLTLYLIESFFDGFVTDFLNINQLLGLIFFVGIVVFFYERDTKTKEVIKKAALNDNFWPIFLSCGAALLVFFKSQYMDISIIISILVSVIGFLLTLLILS